MYKEELFYMYIVLDELKTFVHPCIYVCNAGIKLFLLASLLCCSSKYTTQKNNALVSLAQSAQNTANIYYKIFMKRQL